MTTSSLIQDPTLQHLSYTDLSRATRQARKLIEEDLEQKEVTAKLMEAGHSAAVAGAIYQRARLEIQNEKIRKSLTAVIIMGVLSAIALYILAGVGAAPDDDALARRGYFYLLAMPIVTAIFFIRHVVLVYERKYMR